MSKYLDLGNKKYPRYEQEEIDQFCLKWQFVIVFYFHEFYFLENPFI